MATGSSLSTNEVVMRDGANSTVSDDVMMSDSVDAESPTTDPSTYADAQQALEPMSSQERPGSELPKSVANSPLFKLPLEIRQRIYSYCLTNKLSVLWPAERLAHDLKPQLLQTCWAVYEEAAGALYSNMMHFVHPSDANMFLWAHNPELGRSITRILLQIRDKDVKALWTGYLSSTKPERSLLNDYPNLRCLHIHFRSTFLHFMQYNNLVRRFETWERESTIREVTLALVDRVPTGCEVRILVCCRVLADDARALHNDFPHELEHVDSLGDRRVLLRTPWKQTFNTQVALEIEGQEQTRYFGP
jgi:hypothetical protein